MIINHQNIHLCKNKLVKLMRLNLFLYLLYKKCNYSNYQSKLNIKIHMVNIKQKYNHHKCLFLIDYKLPSKQVQKGIPNAF